MRRDKIVALSFDVEEFDVPLENGATAIDVPFDRQVEISTIGLERIFKVVEKHNIKVTFFCTANYAKAKPELIRRMTEMGCEVASHSYYHSAFEQGDLLRSKEVLEQIVGSKVKGYRAPRMGNVRPSDLQRVGYEWDSSLNPCFLPGRYNNFKASKTPYTDPCGLVEIPASVSPVLRLPLFWLAIHHFPMKVYLWLCRRCLNRTGFLNVYLHPWEFSDNLYEKDLKIQYIIKHNSGQKMVRKLERIIEHFKNQGATFSTLSEYADRWSSKER